MLDWDDLRYFLALSRRGTLARASRELRINATTVGRRLGSLEERLGARLFDRTPDGYLLTQAGRDLLPFAERMEEEAFALERSVVGADERVAGSVVISVTEMIGTRFIAPHLPRLAARYPALTLELSCTPRIVNLARREADIALRLARPREPDLVVRQLSSVHLSLYATEEYLQRRGVPPDPETDLSGHDVLLFASKPAFSIENDWFEARLGSARVVLRSDSVSAIFSAALGGLGVALLPRSVAGPEPRLLRLETRSEPEPRRIWQAVHRELARSVRIRAVVDFLGELLIDEAATLSSDAP